MNMLFASGWDMKNFPDLNGTWQVLCGHWGYSAKISFEKISRKAEVVPATLTWRGHPELTRSVVIWKKPTAEQRRYYLDIIATWVRDCIQKTVLVF